VSKVAIYVRLSQDRDGTKDSVRRQEADCRALAKARGWKVSEVYRDRDASAYNGKGRAGFERMLAAVAAGDVSGVVAWKVDRLGRRTADVVSLVDRLRKAGGFVATCDGLDSSTPTGKAVVEVAAIFAEMESDNTSSRTRRAKLQGAKEGRPSGGGRRPFGYKVGGMELEPSEAELVQQAAADVLAGRSLRGIVRGWNARRIQTSEGNAWSPVGLRRILTGARIAGLRTYHGDVLGSAAWPSIVSETEHERLVSILRDPSRRTSKPGARRYLLTGFLRCGRCGEPLVAAPGPRGRAYACRSQARGAGCGGVRMNAEPLEEIMTEAVLALLDSKEFAQARRSLRRSEPGADLVRQLREDEAALSQLTKDHYVDRRLGRAEFLTAHDALEARIAETDRKLSAASSAGVIHALPGNEAELRAKWREGDLDWRRSVIDALIERIVIKPIGRGKRSGPDRIDVAWRA
jgi:site-specific DNA recombinase